jgi:hypothetical protein
MLDAITANAGVRALTVDELDQVSGGKKATYILVERCTTTIHKGGKEVQTCKTVSETIP